MYFKEKKETNIDSEFKKQNKFSLQNMNKKTLLLIGGGILLLLIIIIILIVSLTSKSNKYTIELVGEEEVYINLGDDYVEPGYIALDKNGDEVTVEVEVTNDIDYSKPGTYEVVYSIGKTSAIRRITILEPKQETDIYLSGELTIYLKVGEKYVEPGYNAVDIIDENIKDKVIVTGSVDTTKKGVYQITYSVTNSRNVTITKTRTVVVE